VCRQELPTDDHQYESRKEREAQEAEDRRGAANALSHNEFMWI
jgi:E3 ubiquitin-protein ligase AIP2